MGCARGIYRHVRPHAAGEAVSMKIDPENGYFIGPDSCHYETEQEARHYAVLGMCGCGWPSDSYNFLRQCLTHCDRRDKTKEWINAEDAITAMVKENPQLTAHIIMHFLAGKDVTEHGGGVGGSWLTKAGEEIVDGDAAPTDAEETT